MSPDDLQAIRERARWDGDPEQYDGHRLADAVGDRRALLAEVDRLRAELAVVWGYDHAEWSGGCDACRDTDKGPTECPTNPYRSNP